MNTNTEFARTQMVNQQVRTWDVLDPAILAVLGAVPREQFVPPRYRASPLPTPAYHCRGARAC